MSIMSCRAVVALRLLAAMLIGLHLAMPHWFSQETAWGLWPAVFVPAPWLWSLAAITLVLIVGGDELLARFGPRVAPRFQRLARLLSAHPAGFRGLAALFAAIPFYAFRIRHLYWGDAKLLVEAIPHPDFRLTYVWQAPLDVFLHARAWALGNRLFGWPDPQPVYAILSTAIGVVFVWVSLELAAWLGRDRIERVLLCGLVATLGTVQLFFGYIENYPFMTAGVLIYIWLAVRALAGEVALVWPATALALTHAFHPSTIILAPSLLYLAFGLRSFRGEEQGRDDVQADGSSLAPRLSARPANALLRDLASLAIPYIVVLAGVLVLMTLGRHGVDALLGVDFPGGGDRRWFVPLFQTTTEWEHYTMFSPGHLIDIVNQQLLVAPVVWPGLIVAGLVAWPRLPRRDAVFRLLLFMAASYLLLILTWNPDYGGQRDWDLFSPAAIPAALLLGYTLPRLLPERPALRAAMWALVATQAFHTAQWIYLNATVRLALP
jgi:hypothetical protein